MKFWTITSEHTEHTNDRSSRFSNKEAAIKAASYRLDAKHEVTGVYVLEAVALAKRSAPPVEVVDL